MITIQQKKRSDVGNDDYDLGAVKGEEQALGGLPVHRGRE